jgi:flavin reductase (DIM6/NTAB) family NADH-FMN oxidoreductase RutF
MECKVIQTLDLRGHDVFIGELVETYCNDDCLVDGVVDFEKVQPILFTSNFHRGSKWSGGYWTIGKLFAEPKKTGKELMNQ